MKAEGWRGREGGWEGKIDEGEVERKAVICLAAYKNPNDKEVVCLAYISFHLM